MAKEEINKKIFELLGLVEKDNGFWCFVERIADNEIVVEGYEGEFSFFTGDGMLLLMEEARKQGLLFRITQFESWYSVIVGENKGDQFTLVCEEKHPYLPKAVSLAYLRCMWRI
ncbi:hypothetical protein [Brevibacillus laterosporus]|uniref:Uncharacterized protein n=1 Tax=Brevibacillus laterosporus TaxID=1465 RepID=A0AAP8U786_BRELA|nr:hypothetical protein [Brevibacillus laterosporus]PPB12944.1 hypothetical protein C4A77_00730 [Brevibacillus laterosporus]